jgi:hypothetical protein
MAEADNSFALSSPADGKLPIVASTSPRVTPVSVLIQSWLMYSEVGQSECIYNIKTWKFGKTGSYQTKSGY